MWSAPAQVRYGGETETRSGVDPANRRTSLISETSSIPESI